MYAKILVCASLTAAVLFGAGATANRELAKATGAVEVGTEKPAVAGFILVRYSKGRWVVAKKFAPKAGADLAHTQPLSEVGIHMDEGSGLLSVK